VGLEGYADFFSFWNSGGCVKKSQFCAAIALDPDIIFFDEPSAGLTITRESLMIDPD